jgi:hypothetical protein
MPKHSFLPVPFWISDKGSPQISNGSEFVAVQAAFQTWQNVSSANIRFEYTGTTPIRSAGRDGYNIVTFSDDATPLGSSTVAVTFSFFRNDFGSLTIDEADIVFNSALDFSTSGEENKFDIQGVATHEIGHLLGLDHSAMISSVMVPFAVPSQLDQRTLTYDDIAGVSEIYPNPSELPPYGLIRGTIQAGTAPVFGAHVVAINSDGTAVVSTLSQPDGSYMIRFVPPGVYRVMAEPLDQPVTEGNVGGGSTSFYRSLKTDFGTTYFGNVAALTEARSVFVDVNGIATANIQILPRSATGLNLTRPAFAPRIGRGSRGTLRVGGEDITEGVSVTTSSDSLVLGTPAFGGRISSVAPTSVTTDLIISPTTALGPKNVAVSRGGATSVVTGALVITEPAASNIGLAPRSGPVQGGTTVTVTGTNFRAGAQVLFGGLPAANVRVIDNGIIEATTPANSPGTLNLQVMNADGTWGTAFQAFTYLSIPPVIGRVSPLNGPPTTSVTIQGSNFDPRPQNVEVLFNGVPGRIVSSTGDTIVTVVPFGATSGPIRVSVFGQAALGPNFTVAAPADITNLAGNTYKFIDASPVNGGSTLSFNSMDDAVTFATLPFNFSLFRDIYLAGSRISISTNGWMSLEAVSTAEFQNGSLPVQTVTRPGGSLGTVAPSLIAPFWDDLCLQSSSSPCVATTGNGSVTTRTIGTAPDRQFIVQWTNMSILDEEGRDLAASLTFEAILFEGSNDIQFVFQSLSGRRSDGSSATIGAQDLKRAAAVQSSFNQPILRTGSFITYRFQNGGYTALAADSTPPTTPVVIDGGATTPTGTELFASWTSEDPDSGIREFQYAIGKTPGGTDVRPFTSTNQNSAIVSGLNLDLGVTYYFAVKAVNNGALTSDVGVSDGIRFDPSFHPEVKIVPWSPQNGSQFSQIAMLAPRTMSVVLKAIDAKGTPISGPGVTNPISVNLAAGQQDLKLVSQLFGTQTFDGWIQAEASDAGLGIYTATGSSDRAELDGATSRPLSSEFVLFHPGAAAILVNPSLRSATVSIVSLETGTTQTQTLLPRSRTEITIAGAVRIRSSEPLSAVERFSSVRKLSLNAAASVSDAAPVLVFPHAVIGGGYKSILTLANVSDTPQDVTITSGSSTGTIRLNNNSTLRLSVSDFLQLPTNAVRTGAVRVTARVPVFGIGMGSLIGTLDIESESGLVTVGSRPAAIETFLPYVAQGDGLFTGLCLATGDRGAEITVDVYEAAGGTPKSRTFTLEANQQLGALLNELVPAVTTQIGGYIRIRADEPIWAWEIYGSADVLASGPPL